MLLSCEKCLFILAEVAKKQPKSVFISTRGIVLVVSPLIRIIVSSREHSQNNVEGGGGTDEKLNKT